MLRCVYQRFDVIKRKDVRSMKLNRIAVTAAAMAVLVLMSSTPIAASSGGLIDVGTDATSYVPITIDGNYEDWQDKPHSQLSYSWDTGNNYHSAALYRDDTYVYLHVRMSPTSYTQFNGYNYHFIADDKWDLYTAAVTPNNVAIVNGNNLLEVRNQNNYQLISGAVGYVTRADGQSDEWELRIPISAFTGPDKKFRTFSFQCTNLGEQVITATGTPTLPFLLAGTGFVIAAVGYGIKRRKRSAK